MTALTTRSAHLARTFADTLDLLRKRYDVPRPEGEVIEGQTLSSLLDRCREVREKARLPERGHIALISHMACTGGTLIARSIQAQPNVDVLSEVDPFSTIPRDFQHRKFAPSDLILLARSGTMDVGRDTIAEMFLGALEPLHRQILARGRHLVLREHSHSRFCTDHALDEHPGLSDLLLGGYDVRHVVTVRHPIDSWLALKINKWVHFTPATLDEYCRRYQNFLNEHASRKWIKYEHFVSDPDKTMREICVDLGLPSNPDWQDLFPIISMSGDSGRSGDRIKPRPRRPVKPEVVEEARNSREYENLCERMGYDPAIDFE